MRVFVEERLRRAELLLHVWLLPAGGAVALLRLTVLGDGRRRRLQHVLRQIDEDLVELAATQQVEILDDLET